MLDAAPLPDQFFDAVKMTDFFLGDPRLQDDQI